MIDDENKPRRSSGGQSTATARSAARYARAAATLGGVTLDQARADKLAAVLASTGESRAEWVRRMIDEAVIGGPQSLPSPAAPTT